jgi:hypothetical protein
MAGREHRSNRLASPTAEAGSLIAFIEINSKPYYLALR